jgi:hypothetical protein
LKSNISKERNKKLKDREEKMKKENQRKNMQEDSNNTERNWIESKEKMMKEREDNK